MNKNIYEKIEILVTYYGFIEIIFKVINFCYIILK
nr:MAG TPA: hypothetical protein [Caudoviricetes sp.]DAK87635.1 MAG TPA: hypothetical protein [Bacteriophage sp.]